MKENLTDIENKEKNPYSYNGDVLNLPSDLPSLNEGSYKSQLTDTEDNTSKTSHNKKVHNKS